MGTRLSCGSRCRRSRKGRIVCTAILWAAGVFAQGPEFHGRGPGSFTVNVPATASPYLAGMPPGTPSRMGDSAPQQSPVLVLGTLSHAVAVTFTAVGAVEHTPACPPDCKGPNGTQVVSRHIQGPENGISDIAAPMDSLVGVFLSDELPNRGKAPGTLDFHRRNFSTLSPKLKQVFFIGNGRTASGALRRFLVPPGATRLYLGVMDAYEWNNNSGSFTVTVHVEHDQEDASMFTVDTNITFADWACLPGRTRCTPDRPVAEEKAPGEFHVIVPAASEWSISVPDIKGTALIHDAEGTVCFGSGECTGPQGRGAAAGPGFLAPGRPAGALISKVIDGRIYFSVNHRRGERFRDHEGYFEFEVSVH
jgi:hypothetical protein